MQGQSKYCQYVLWGLCLCIITAVAGCGRERFEIIDRTCGKCHAADIVYEKKRSMEEWERLLHGMQARGLQLSELEEENLRKIILQHLSFKGKK